MDIFPLQLWSIYAAGNTVPIPFLRATDISPIALLSDNVLGGMQQQYNRGTVEVETIQELFTGDGQSRKGRRGQNEVSLYLHLSFHHFSGSVLVSSEPLKHLFFSCFCTADAPSSQCLSKAYFKSHTVEPCPGFSLPQNVSHLIYFSILQALPVLVSLLIIEPHTNILLKHRPSPSLCVCKGQFFDLSTHLYTYLHFILWSFLLQKTHGCRHISFYNKWLK